MSQATVFLSVFVVQTVKVARCYKSKLKAVLEGLLALRKADSTSLQPELLSVHCLELFVNAVLLDLQVGKQAIALRRFDQARVSMETNTSSFKGSRSEVLF